MKELFTTPVCELILFSAEDMITTSMNGIEIDIDDEQDAVNLPGVHIIG